MKSIKANHSGVQRYSIKQQFEFFPFVEKKILSTQKLITSLKDRIESANENKTSNPGENAANGYNRDFLINEKFNQEKLLANLKNASLRITKHNTYGTCSETGKLIPTERLKITPHTTVTAEGQKIREKRKRKN